MRIAIDIETIPSQEPHALADVRDTIAPPATLKKAESIAAWWDTEAAAAAEAAWRKQALDGGLRGEIVSIAVCKVEDPDQSWVRCRAQGESEAALLREFFAVVEGWERAFAATLPAVPSAWPYDPPWPVAHNASFDLGFLWRRARVLGVPTPRWLPGPTARVGKDYGCTMLTWAGYGGRVSLDNLCRALDIPSPKDSGMDGAQVFDAWRAGDYTDIATYNLSDATATADVWQRLQGSC